MQYRFLWALAGFAGLSLSAADAEACGFRSTFFKNAGEGDIAYIRGAANEQSARRQPHGWCQVRNGGTLRLQGKTMIFAVSNRAQAVRQPRLYVARIYRRSPDTRRDPLFSLWRRGLWQNPHCDGRGAAGEFDYDERGKASVLAIFKRLRTFNPARRGTCDGFARWLGNAFGRPGLSLDNSLRFIADTPTSVLTSGIDNWSFHQAAVEPARGLTLPSG